MQVVKNFEDRLSPSEKKKEQKRFDFGAITYYIDGVNQVKKVSL